MWDCGSWKTHSGLVRPCVERCRPCEPRSPSLTSVKRELLRRYAPRNDAHACLRSLSLAAGIFPRLGDVTLRGHGQQPAIVHDRDELEAALDGECRARRTAAMDSGEDAALGAATAGDAPARGRPEQRLLIRHRHPTNPATTAAHPDNRRCCYRLGCGLAHPPWPALAPLGTAEASAAKRAVCGRVPPGLTARP